MTVKQHIDHGIVQKVCPLHSHVSNFLKLTLSPPLCYSLKMTME